MYYEVYVDVLFVENLWINVCLLLLTSRLMGYQTDRKRIAAGAALGSMGACLLETGSAYLTTAGWFLGTILTAAVMIRTAYGKRNTYIKCLVVLYLEGWLLGGTVRYLEQFYVLAGLMMAGGSMVLAGILLAVEWVLVKLREREDIICPVALYLGEASISTEGLVDTGNSLRDPVSGRPVSVCTEPVLQALVEKSGKELFPRLIPYQTVAEHGLLKAYVLDRMEITTNTGICVCRHPILAGMPMASRQYELILHQELLSSQEEAT